MNSRAVLAADSQELRAMKDALEDEIRFAWRSMHYQRKEAAKPLHSRDHQWMRDFDITQALRAEDTLRLLLKLRRAGRTAGR